MANSKKAITTFTAGEWAPTKDARQDLEKAGAALRTCKNMIVDRYGGVFRRPGLKYISTVKPAVILSYVSYSGSGTLYGVTEFGDLSDPPKKYRNMHSNYVGLNRKEAGNGAGSTLESMQVSSLNRTSYNDAGTQAEQLAYHQEAGSKGNDWSLPGSPPTGTPKQIGVIATGTAGDSLLDTLEDYDPGSGNGWFGSWWDTFTKGKRRKYHSLASMVSPSLEDASSPFFSWVSSQIGSTVTGTARTYLRVYAVAGTDVWTIYTLYVMQAPGVGSGPATSLYVSLAPGDQSVDASGNDVFLVNGAANAGSGNLYAYSKFVVPMNTSIRFNLNIAGETSEQFPDDWSSATYPTTDADIQDAGGRNWLYLPEATVGVEGDDEFAELLTLEDAPTDLLELAGSGVTVGTEEWAQTSSYTGGITAESHSSISYTMRTVKVTFNLTGMTVGYTYPITVTYSERDIGGANPNSGQEVVNHVATAASEEFTYRTIAQVGRERRVINMSQGTGVAPTPITTLEGETLLWKARVLAAGESVTDAQVTLIDGLAAEINANVTKNSIEYMLPFIGGTIVAGMVPLYDLRSWGSSDHTVGSSNFVDADISDATGLQGGANKRLSMPFQPNQIAAWPNFGIGMHIHDTASGGGLGGFCAVYWNNGNNHIYGLVADTATPVHRFHCGAVAGSNATDYAATVNTDVHLYGQRNSQTDRDVFTDGVNRASTSYSDANGVNGADGAFPVMGDSLTGGVRSWTGLVGCVYFTNGNMADADQTALQTALANFKTATGR